jgi:hypothetical protein
VPVSFPVLDGEKKRPTRHRHLPKKASSKREKMEEKNSQFDRSDYERCTHRVRQFNQPDLMR